ncbi:hypothetical protein [Cryobacterium aureum]|uniref:hypothetical protein n=1 Tax=Cryobacterium aureum TaxID=995037 RepID=UPI000CF53E79|nr:hypothetical protein [Cryobacterium aureum]
MAHAYQSLEPGEQIIISDEPREDLEELARWVTIDPAEAKKLIAKAAKTEGAADEAAAAELAAAALAEEEAAAKAAADLAAAGKTPPAK